MAFHTFGREDHDPVALELADDHRHSFAITDEFLVREDASEAIEEGESGCGVGEDDEFAMADVGRQGRFGDFCDFVILHFAKLAIFIFDHFFDFDGNLLLEKITNQFPTPTTIKNNNFFHDFILFFRFTVYNG